VTEAIVLAGGMGTRLRAAVADLPKPMAPVAGRPFLCYILDQLAEQGIERVILSVGYLWQSIHAYFGASYAGIALDYSVEEQPLGTGGALSAALLRAETSRVLSMNGDSWLGFDYSSLAALEANGEPFALALALRRLEDASRYGRVEMDGRCVRRFHAAGAPGPGLVNAGVYLLARDIFSTRNVPAHFSFEAFVEKQIDDLRPLGVIADGHFIDIGIPSSFELAQTVMPLWTAK